MAAVVRIVAEKGLKGLSYRSVAKDAGVNHNLISHHFGSMDSLLTLTLEWSIEKAIENTKLELFAEFDERYADVLMESVIVEPEIHLFQFEMLLEARRRPELRKNSRNLYDGYTRSMRNALSKRGIEADDDFCRTVFAALDGLMLQVLTLGDTERTRSSVIALGRLLADATQK
ncbi:TetR family transcriptional regulator [Corynebacterium sp.]|uniref:TetR/AcrR family transcriptional regulator n=1 Tax=Corynebacterium sp. TaxID=1720 RepID=UPI00257ED55F|nr:TetR family transcriptional regulator [Corynebacterium sp.]